MADFAWSIAYGPACIYCPTMGAIHRTLLKVISPRLNRYSTNKKVQSKRNSAGKPMPSNLWLDQGHLASSSRLLNQRWSLPLSLFPISLCVPKMCLMFTKSQRSVIRKPVANSTHWAARVVVEDFVAIIAKSADSAIRKKLPRFAKMLFSCFNQSHKNSSSFIVQFSLLEYKMIISNTIF